MGVAVMRKYLKRITSRNRIASTQIVAEQYALTREKAKNIDSRGSCTWQLEEIYGSNNDAQIPQA